MKIKWMLMVGGLMLGAALLLSQPGCEGSGSPDTGNIDSYFANNPFVSDPRDPTSPHDVSVAPASALISYVGQAISFTVKGGRPVYSWAVVNGNGTITPSPGDGGQAIYSASVIAENSVIVYDAQGHSAIASINSSATNALAISPTSALLTNNTAVAVFSVSNGRPPYHWGLLNGNGTLNTTSGSSVLYTRTSAGDNGVTVSDSNGGSASAAIQQP